MRFPRVRSFLVLLVIGLLPGLAAAQSSITGVVKDTSGAVLPGVTVEAASPALIEGAKSAVTDEQGLYRIVDLRPGPYTVTFTLAGCNTLKRDGKLILDESDGYGVEMALQLVAAAGSSEVNVVSMAPNTENRSARMPPGPVTLTLSPARSPAPARKRDGGVRIAPFPSHFVASIPRFWREP